MPPRPRDEHFDDDPELPDPSDMDEDESDPTVPCPFCRKPVHEATDICHHCGSFIGGADDPERFPSWTVILIVGLILASMLGGLLYFLRDLF